MWICHVFSFFQDEPPRSPESFSKDVYLVAIKFSLLVLSFLESDDSSKFPRFPEGSRDPKEKEEAIGQDV